MAGQGKTHCCSVTRHAITFNPDLAFVLLDHLFTDSQSQTATALIFGTHSGVLHVYLEQLGDVILAYADAVILDGDSHQIRRFVQAVAADS